MEFRFSNLLNLYFVISKIDNVKYLNRTLYLYLLSSLQRKKKILFVYWTLITNIHFQKTIRPTSIFKSNILNSINEKVTVKKKNLFPVFILLIRIIYHTNEFMSVCLSTQ